MSDSYYDTAQICVNGHVINSSAGDFPNINAAYCPKCGAATLMNCPACKAPIRGHYTVPGVLSILHFTSPAYCHSCGQPYPWTSVALAAARELADTLDDLTEDERVELKESIGHLIRETPRTPVAETKFRSLMRKAGKEAYGGMKSILIDVVSEAEDSH